MAADDGQSDICVVGAGVLGLTAARELAVRGHTVTLLDTAGPGTVLPGASHRSFAWINANNKPPHAYHRLNVLGMAEHDRLQDELGGRWFHRSGSIVTVIDPSPERRETFLHNRLTRLRAEDYPVEPVAGADLPRLEPAVDWGKLFDGVPERALHCPGEGWLDQDLFAAGLLDDLAHRGVVVQQGTVTHVASGPRSAELILDDGTVLTPDIVVLAAGAGSRHFGLPVADPSHPDGRTHSFLGLTEPTDAPLGTVLISDAVNVRPRHDRRLWVQLPGMEHRVVEAGGDLTGEAARGILDEVRHRMESVLGDLFGTPVPVDRVYLSARSLPEDGFPLVGFTDPHRRIFALVAHSGMTLAPLLGRLVAEEIGGGTPQDEAASLLATFRPDRPGAAVPAATSPFIGSQ